MFKNKKGESVMIKEILETKNRRILATKIQSACNESHQGIDIIFNILLKYVPSTILKEELKRAKESKDE
jgi:hypothetical protein